MPWFPSNFRMMTRLRHRVLTRSPARLFDAMRTRRQGSSNRARGRRLASSLAGGRSAVSLIGSVSGRVRAMSARHPARDPRARPFLWYLLAWNSAVGLSASFFPYHMLRNLATGFALAALHGVAVAAVRIVSAPLWGRAVDRFGARPVLAVCSFGIAAVPAIWLFPTPAFLWPLALEAALSGALWGGHGLAAMDLTVDLSPAQAPLFTSPSSHDSLAPPLRVCDSPERKE